MITAPKHVRGAEFFAEFVHELGSDKACSILDVHPTTMRRWLRGAIAVPRMAVLALFWETNYGRSIIDCDQVNEIRLLYHRVQILERQYARAKDIVTGLRRMHSGSANEPLFEELPALFDTMPLLTPYGTSRPIPREQVTG